MSRKVLLVLVCAIGACLSGCGQSFETASTHKYATEIANDASQQAGRGNSVESDSASTLIQSKRGANSENAIARNRKIIYNTVVGLVVKDYANFETELPILVETYGGFVANSHTDRSYNNSQSGQWTIRVPVLQYSDLLSGLNSLGFAESRREDAQDVTEEFVDLEARIKNKKALETRVISILEDRKGKLSEILEIERELSRVREEIERMEGRLRFLRERTSLATITIKCREELEYQPAAAPTFVSRITSAFGGSIMTLQRGAADLVVAVVALLPWITLIGFAIWFLRGWLIRARNVVMKRAAS